MRENNFFLMSFEKQICKKCGLVRFCYYHLNPKKENQWLCEPCYSWVIEQDTHKDEVRAIMIQCGIEDIEK